MAGKLKGKISIKSLSLDEALDPVSASIWGEDVRIPFSRDLLKTLFATVDWVYIVVDLLANECMSAKFRVMKRTPGPEGKDIITPADDHPLNATLKTPYKAAGIVQSNMSYLMGCEFFLGGNFLAWKHGSGASTQLLPLSFDSVQMEFGKDGKLLNYVCTVETEETTQKTVFPASEILHIKKANPYSLYWGLSPFMAGKPNVMFNKLTVEYLNNFYFKGAAPQMVLETETNINHEQMLRMVKAFEQAYTGRKNLRRTLALPKGVTAKSFPHSIADQRLVDLIKLNRETILNLLHVPKHAMSLQEAGSLGSEEYKTALQYLWSSTLTPTLNLFAEAMTEFFAKELKGGYLIAADTSGVSVLREDLMAKALLAEKMLQTLTLNEVRQAVWSRDPIQGGDVVASIQPVPGLPDNMQPQMPNKNPTETPAPVTTDVQTPEEAPPAPKKFATIDTDQWLGERKGDFESRQKATDDGLRGKIDEAEKTSGDLIVGMVDKAITTLLRSKNLKEEIDLPALRRRIEDAIEEMVEDYQQKLGPTLSASMDLGADLGLNTVFGATDLAAIEAVMSRDEAKRRNILKAREISAFRQISETTTEEIMQKVEEGMKQNMTIPDIARDIVGHFETRAWERAKTIARTETMVASSIGQAAAMKAAREVIPGLKKVWVTSGDERVRGSGKYGSTKANHADMHGQVQDAEDPFVDPRNGDRLQYPRDTKGKPESIIQCRCTWVTAAPEDLSKIVSAIGGQQ